MKSSAKNSKYKNTRRQLSVAFFVFGLMFVILYTQAQMQKKSPQKIMAAESLFAQLLDQKKEASASSNTTLQKTKEEEASPSQTVRVRTTPKLTAEELRALAQNNKVCELLNSSFKASDAILVLVDAIDVFPIDSETDRAIYELMTNKVVQNENLAGSSRLTLLYKALIMANLMSGSEQMPPNYSEALTILDNLIAAEPDNGAYDFFKASILDKLGANTDDLKPVFLSAFNKNRFDTYITKISRRIYEKSYVNATYYAIGYTALAYLPIPDITNSYSLLKKILLENDSDFNQKALQFSINILNQVQPKPQDYPYEFRTWTQIDNVIFNKIAQFAWPKTQLPNPYQDRHQQYLVAVSKIPPSPYLQLISDPDSNKACSTEDFIKAFLIEKQNYIDYQNL